jgi:heterodisulfide reductase subunit D
MESREQIVRETHAFHCLECGKCTAACPVSRVNHSFSPRALLSRLLTGDLDSVLTDDKLYTCLTCGLCRTRCPSDVRYTELMMLTRIEAFAAGHKGNLSHGGVLHEVMRLHAAAKLEQQRGDWLGEGLRTAENGEILYFAGCQPYFDSALAEIGVQATEIGRSAVKLFNALGITPTVIPNERCCGHDLLWIGDEENFNKLMERNLDAVKKTGAKKLVTSCAECYRTFALDYHKRAGKLDFEVQHISQFLADNMPALKSLLVDGDKKVTYHDPCRLGRQMGVYDQPRQVLAALPGAEIREMAHNRHNAVCCGTSAWLNCDQFSKRIQVGRLKEAEATGAETVITTCPKCYIHFTCAKSEKGCGEGAVKIEVQDLCVLLAKSLKGGKPEKAKPSKG